MRKVLDVLRLAYAQHVSQATIATSLGLSQSTVSHYLQRFRATGLPWPLPGDLDVAQLEARLFARPAVPAPAMRPMPDWATIRRELAAHKGVTLQLLWQEYKATAPDGYQYTQFCRHYHAWVATLEPVLRRDHPAGERIYVDYAGVTVPVVDPTTDTMREAQIFVAAPGASHLLYVEATWTQTLPDWIDAHVRMLEYYGGVPALIVPDNAKTSVPRPCYYEPELHPTYADFAAHYATAILPARVRHPRDKAPVETAVQIAEREVLAPLRHWRFHSLVELNAALVERREIVNERSFQKLDTTRRALFTELERSALRPLPATRYELAEWRRAKVNIDYHISVDQHLYSVPYRLVGATVDVRLTTSTVEILHQGTRVAAHVRSLVRGRATTDPTHRPKAHQRHLDWTPSRLVQWGTTIGPATGAVVQALLDRYPHPEQGYRACLGLLSLRRRYGDVRLDAACTRALATGAASYRSVKSILAASLDQVPPSPGSTLALPATHAHIRGPAYYRDDPDPSSSTGVSSAC